MALARAQALDFLPGVTQKFSAPFTVVPKKYPYYFIVNDAQQLQGLLARPHDLFIEDGPRDQLGPALASLQQDNPDFAISLNSITAYQSAVPEILARAFNARFNFKIHRLLAIRTCLQEALANAVVHGNLGLRNTSTTHEDFISYYHRIAQLLSETMYGFRRISITVWHYNTYVKIAVANEGFGFPYPARFENTGGHHVYGRGLFIIRSLSQRAWIGTDNKTLCMTFV